MCVSVCVSIHHHLHVWISILKNHELQILRLSMIYRELILCMVWHTQIIRSVEHCFKTLCWPCFPLPIELLWQLCHKLVDHTLLFQQPIYLFSCQLCTVVNTVALFWITDIILNIVLVILYPLYFHIDFWINFSFL